MHPAPQQLDSMSTPDLRAYRVELEALRADRGDTGYLNQLQAVDRVLWVREAREQGEEAGKAAASYVIDGNQEDSHYARLERMMDEGDPALDDYLPARPNLSGEWADSMTPARLFEAITGLDAHAEASWNYDGYQSVLEPLCDAWEAGVDETFGHECERLVREALA
jgi:hypothetical protein